MEMNKAKNLLDHEKEIFSRPARVWFQDKNDLKRTGKGLKIRTSKETRNLNLIVSYFFRRRGERKTSETNEERDARGYQNDSKSLSKVLRPLYTLQNIHATFKYLVVRITSNFKRILC